MEMRAAHLCITSAASLLHAGPEAFASLLLLLVVTT